MYKCKVCGYISDEKIDVCPKCGSKEFSELNAEDEAKIHRSRITNDIHMDMRILLAQVQELAEEGIEEDLDPNCVAIFQRAKKDAYELGQMIKAELKAHMSKDKWG